ncbi:PAS domain S-box protein [Methanoplanus limicola]|uniref:histidine kinase n=1 Tax=Methanoplanus limicola DSM 2279 TaxID=937775 RepID=H1YWC2_9EURY|nr:PAS domain S-box protein [Methanoplanus limicola]EHQ34844.1 PAS/PAC sensor signal transduction histidine kinase [Methanoplanus limicola DSM 2279]
MILSEDIFSAVFNSSAAIMAVSTKEDGRYMDVNDAFIRKTGYQRSEVIGKTATELNLFVNPEDRLNALSLLEKAGKIIDLEIPVRKKNGEVMYGIFSADSLTLGETPCLLTTMVDITARKIAEEELDLIRNRLELAVDASEHGLWDWNLDTDEIYFSPRYYRMLGYEPGELPMSLSTWVELMHPEDRELVVPRIYGYVREARPYREDFRLRTKGGSWMWISGRGKSYEVDDDGIPHRAVGTHVDVNYRKQTEEALKTLNKKLNLLSSVTRHDIINQISGICAYQELLKRELDEEEIREYLEPMIKATGVIEKKIRFTSDYQDLGIYVPAWQNVDSLIKSVILLMPGTCMKVEYETKGLVIYADPMLEKVFYNLFENAFWHGGNVTLIRVSFHEREGCVVVVVEDDGSGIADGMKEKIFEHGVGSNTGLGLFLVREILDITGISISETGTEGNGARFEIKVPDGGYRI